ncbi:MAG TPA: aspartate kinase [Bacteroidales bacterium]|nr:aspartate kinase [Bacteroidales bacterium]HNR41898.1 aspartate kinase [Bacteroidales bacterium]HQG77081.1 aspartate kinase [Bacteroidales bacterium]
MKVFKFGGASVKDAAGIKNLAKIVSGENGKLVVVVSAFGKTTNALEKVLKLWFAGDKGYREHLEELHSYHSSVAGGLFSRYDQAVSRIDITFSGLREYLESLPRHDFDHEYDQIVSYGEIWSTIIVAAYLELVGLKAEWIDIRGNLITDDRFRDANILWNESTLRVRSIFNFMDKDIYVTQGFIGGTVSGLTTTLGREGSDYSAALIANMLDAESVVVWKDVPGLLNADPKWFPDAVRLDEVSYREAVEMTFSGAKIIHPKTIKPLHNKNIPLHVKSFISPDESGTVIKSEITQRHGLPVFIRKENQIMVSIMPRDFSFVMGDYLSRIFCLFMQHGIRVSLVKASAVSISVCIDDDRMKVDSVMKDLNPEFNIVYNENVELLTVRHYTAEAVNKITINREILLEQRSRNTVRFVVRKTGQE